MQWNICIGSNPYSLHSTIYAFIGLKPQRKFNLVFITSRSGILDSDWSMATSSGQMFPNNRGRPRQRCVHPLLRDEVLHIDSCPAKYDLKKLVIVFCAGEADHTETGFTLATEISSIRKLGRFTVNDTTFCTIVSWFIWNVISLNTSCWRMLGSIIFNI